MSSPSLSDLGKREQAALDERGSQQRRACSNATWNSIHNGVIAVFQRKGLPDHELYNLNEGVRTFQLYLNDKKKGTSGLRFLGSMHFLYYAHLLVRDRRKNFAADVSDKYNLTFQSCEAKCGHVLKDR